MKGQTEWPRWSIRVEGFLLIGMFKNCTALIYYGKLQYSLCTIFIGIPIALTPAQQWLKPQQCIGDADCTLRILHSPCSSAITSMPCITRTWPVVLSGDTGIPEMSFCFSHSSSVCPWGAQARKALPWSYSEKMSVSPVGGGVPHQQETRSSERKVARHMVYKAEGVGLRRPEKAT